MTDKPKYALTYEERKALPIIQRLLERKPEFAGVLLEGMTKDGAVNVLLQAQRELKDLHLLAQAMTAAAAIIVKMDEANNVSQEGEQHGKQVD